MGKRAARLLASLAFAGAVAGCVPPAPLSVSGTLPPPSTTFTLIGDDAVAKAARALLIENFAARGLRYSSDRPDRLVVVTLADRPRSNGAASGKSVPETRDASQWVDRPVKGGLFARNRREVRLTIRFLTPDGILREERVVSEVVKANAPAPDVARMLRAALD